MPPPCANDVLERLVSLSHEMINLADAGDEARSDQGCGVVFGKLRDEGYALRGLARRELQVHANRRGLAPVEPSALLRPRVLIVDDDQDTLRYLAAWFTDAGFEALMASDGHEALELATAHRPALISLDMSMPEKSGLSTYRDLRAQPELKEIPVIFITAIGVAFRELSSRRRGIPEPEGFLTKPIDLEQLERTVRAALR